MSWRESGGARLSSLVATLAVFLVLASGFALVRASAGERFPWPESLSRIFGSRSARTSNAAPIANVYTWNAAGSGLFNTSSNWTPDRTSPASTDIIVFNNGGAITASNVQSQTIGELQIGGGTNVTLQAVATDTLTIGPGLGALAIANGSQLSTSGTNVLNFSLPGTATGSTSGVFTVTSGNSLLNANTFTVNNGGFLKGGGTVSGPVSVSSGGTIAPGTSAGILSTGNVTFSSGSTYAVEIGGTTPGTGHDQLNVTGTVSLGGAGLSITSLSYTPAGGDSFTIINNDGADAVSGTFAGLPQGATVSTNFLGSGKSAIISYTGGSGNDVVISVVTPETDVSVTGGNLIISDSNGGNSNDTLTLSLNGANIRINDPNNGMACGSGATTVDANTCDVPLASVTGNIQVSGQGGNDTLTLNLATGDFIPAGGLSYDGGNPTTGPGDKLIISGGAQGTVVYNYTNAHDGNVVMSGFGTVTYTGLEPITNSGTATDVIFNLPGVANTATLSDLGGGNSRLASGGTFEQTDFANPSGSVTINGGALADTITVNALANGYSSLILNGNEGDDTVNLAGNITFASGKNLDVDLQNDDPTPGIDSIILSPQILLQGAGSATLKASKSISLAPSSQLQTQDGAIVVEANRQASPTSGDFNGVDNDGGLLQTNGSGNITVMGTGGAGDFTQNYGVYVHGAGEIRTTGTGTVTVVGDGGAGSGGATAGTENYGIFVYQVNSLIVTSSGAINLTGTGGSTNDNGSFGVIVAGGGIQTNGAGTLTMNGTGGTCTGGSTTFVNSAGVFVTQDDAPTPVGGFVTSLGSGANAGNIIITGTSGNGGNGAGQGVRVDAPGSVTAVDGSITINGTGGACGNACLGTSIRGPVTATGTGAITLNGTGAASSGAFPTHGVSVRNGGNVTVKDGNLTITGTGGNGTDNAGFTVASSGTGTLQVSAGGTGTITINADTIRIAGAATVNAGANAVSLRQKTNGVGIDLGSTTDAAANTLELADAELDRITSGGPLNIGNNSSGTITVSANITRPVSTNMTLTTNGDVLISGGQLNTGGGTLLLDPGNSPAAVKPTKSGNDVTVSTLSFGSDLEIDVNGATVDTQYNQLNVAGSVNLTGVSLVIGGSYTPSAGDSFVIVNNDGTSDAVVGTFNGLPEGATVSVNGTNKTITYAGGDGNDVVLLAVCVPPSTVYVDDNWVGTPPGTDPDGAGPATSFGCDSFAKIQDGVNGVTVGGTVIVYAGTYPENVLVNKPVTLLGPNAAIDPNTGSRIAEAIVMPAVTETSVQGSSSGTVFRVGSNSGHIDATIKGFTIDGHNAQLTGGRTLNGVEIHTGAGIVNSIGSFDTNPGAFDATMIVQNNIIQNLERYGVLADNVAARPAVTGTDVSHNKIDNLPSGNNFGGGRGRGIAFEENLYGTASWNVITRVNVGWQDDNYNLASPGAATLVSHNTIHTYHRGIFHNLQYQNASDATISDNSIFVETTGDFAASTTNFGIELAAIQSAVGVNVTNNNSTGNVYGILLWNLPTTADITVTGGTLSGNNYGVYATSNDPQFAAGAASHSLISGVTISNATVAGIGIDDGSNISTTALGITGGTSVSGGPLGLLLNGPGARVFNNNLNNASFSGQTGNYITLQNGASAGLEINGTGATFDGVNGGTATLGQLYALEDRVTDAIDDGTVGFVRLKAGNIFVTPSSFTAVTLTPNIQRGVNAGSAGDVLHAAAGLYPNIVTVNKAMTLQGANVGVGGAGTRGAESVIRTSGNQTAVVSVSAPNVIIDGFLIEGDDPLVTGAALASGDDANASYGVRVTAAFGNLTVANNIVKHVAIGLRADGAAQGSLITNNWFDSIGNFDFGYGVSLRTDYYADVTNNLMTRAWTGIHINDHHTAGGPGSFNLNNNEIHSYAGGILYWLNYNAATGATINGNTITAASGAVANNFGILIVTLQNAVSTSITNNAITGHNYGVGLFNVPTTNTITLGATNSISNSSLAGVFLTDNLNFNPIGTTNFLAGGPGAVSTVNVNGLSIGGNTGDGVKVEGLTNSQTLSVTGATITGDSGTKGVELVSAQSHLSLTASTVTGFPTGVSLVNSPGAVAHFNRIISGTTAIDNPNNQAADLENNWWGCNAGPGNAGCGAANGSGADFDPWIVLGVSAAPNPIPPFGNSTVTADMTHNSGNAVPPGVTTLPLPAAAFTATNGTIATPVAFTAGQSQSTFTSTSNSDGQACVTVDNQQVCTAITIAPEIVVEEPIGNDLTDNASTVGFGNQTLNTPSAPKTFTIRNTGGGTLTIGAITVDGPNPGDFSVDTTGMSPTVGAGGNTAFTVTFTPTALGARSAAIHIANNDADENPFDIALTGNGDCPTTLTVNVTADDPDATPGDGVCETATGNGFCSLRAAIMESNALTSCAPLTINFNLLPGSEPQLIILESALPPITRTVTIQGPVGQMVSVDGNQSYRIFEISSAPNVTISNLIIQNASEANNGAGLLNSGNATVNLFNLAFTGNQNDDANGGAIYNAAGTLNIWNSTIANNQAQNSGKGGGIYNDSGTVTLTNDTISGNGSDTAGGGVYNNAGTVSVRNTIIAGNPSPGWDIFGTFTSQGHNIIGNGDTGTGFIDGVNNDHVGNQTTPFDPLLDLFDDHGGGTLTFSLLPNSPAIDGGDDCVLTGCSGASPLISADQRSVARPQGAHVDIGAFELATYVVNTTADHAPGLCEALPGGDCTLREAINAANGNFFGPTRIAFGIPTGSDPGCVAGLCTIALDNTQGVLPEINTQLFIDGYTQTGATPNTLDLGDGDNAALKIVLSGANLGAGAIGLDFCTGANNSNVQGLVVNGFQGAGIQLDDDGSTNVQGNFIGTDVTGMVAVPNGTGIAIINGFDNFIGGDSPAARNVISGNTGDGVSIFGDNTAFTSLEGNYIGTKKDGASALANNIGVNLFGFSGGNTIGCETPNGDNVISGNTAAGIRMNESAFNLVQGNFIGTDRTGAAATANGIGVDLWDASFNAIGGDGFGNLISGNTGAGIRLRSTVDSNDPSSDNVIYGNKIGTNFQGLAAIPNNIGILIQNSDTNDIGSGDAPDANLISGNTSYGVRLEGSNDVVLWGNRIGTEATGVAALPNGAGVSISGGSDNEVGCTFPGSGNVISGNTSDGVQITGSASNNFVQSNLIGVQVDGVSPLANGGVGVEVYIGANGNVIGGDSGGGVQPSRGFTAKTNSKFNAAVVGGGGCSKRGTSNSRNTRVFRAAQAQKAKAAALAQKSSRSGRTAKTFAATKAFAGAKVKGVARANKNGITPNFVESGANVIANNGEEGVKVSSSGDINNLISQNSIYANGKLGINLVGGSEDANGVTANDANDGDTGPNYLQNYPVITSAITDAGVTTISGTLNSNGDQDHLIEFFMSSAKDPSGFGEGQTYLGATVVSTSGNDATFTFNPGSPVPIGSWITATAIDTSNNTSEFSGAVLVTPAVLPVVTVALAADTTVPEEFGPSLVFRFSRDETSGPLTVNFSIGGTADPNTDYTHSGDASFTPPTGTVVFAAGQATVDVTIVPTADNTPEPNETVTLAVTSGGGYTIGAPNSATGTIIDNDCPSVFVVNTSSDTAADDANPGDGVCAIASNPAVCSLRAAIQEANALTMCGPITINLTAVDINFPINLLTPLPAIDHDVQILGNAGVIVQRDSAASNLRIFDINPARTVQISNLIMSKGSISGSGGVINNQGSLTLTNCTVSEGQATSGGGIYNSGTLNVDNSTLSTNQADNGGAIYNGGTLNLTNVTVGANVANGNGGGILNDGVAAVLTNVTVANNRCDNDTNASGSGGGVFIQSGSVRLHNTIVAHNFKGGSGTSADDVNGTLDPASSFNLIGDGTGITNLGSLPGNNQIGTAGSPIDPLLGLLINNGGNTAMYGLLYNSPALDAGDDCVFGNTCSPSLGTALTLDQRGQSRKADGDLVAGAHVDIGAYERQSTESRIAPSGSNINIDINDARLHFPGVDPSEAATVLKLTTVPVPGDAPAGSGPAFDITPTFTYTGPVDVCFYLPAITNSTTFNSLKIFHRESGLLVDHGSVKDFNAKTVCTQVTSFSEFVVNQSVTPTATDGTVSGQIGDEQGKPVEGAAVRLSGSQTRLTITDAEGKYHFDNLETNGLYVVTPSRANFTFTPNQRSFSQLGARTDATFTASPAAGGLNPLDTTEYFVRQQYLDFLGREPDEAGFNFWVNNIESCGNNLGCREVKRIDTSAAFFLSIEFQQTGYLVYRTYQAAYGDLPNIPVPVRLNEFRADAAMLSKNVIVLQNEWQRTLENNKKVFAEDFVKRSRFVTAYPTSLSPAEFVDRLFATAGIPQTDGDYSAAVGEFGGSADTVDTAARARVLRRLAENQLLSRREFNQAFVLMEYFGYLRRDPNAGQDTDFGGYNFWLDKLDRFHGNFQDAEMVKAFLTSIEYRARFPR